jgi:sugar lactone lactonase YvrE
MIATRQIRFWVATATVSIISLLAVQVNSQGRAYRVTDGWAQTPRGMEWGQLIAIEPDADGNIYAFHRCSASDCVGSNVAPLLKFDKSGRHLKSFGAGMLVWPHGLDIDNDGNIWITDGHSDSGRGQQVLKLSPDGDVLMTIGTAGVDGYGPYTFNGVADVLVADDGSIFVADGHVNSRIVKYSASGEFITEWGKAGTAPGEFNLPHALAMDSQGRLFVSDRENLRIQIFDQEGRYIDEWAQFGRVSGLSIDSNDTLYAAAQNEEAIPSIATGIFVASAVDGATIDFIPDIYSESVVADGSGSIYTGLRAHGGEPQVIDDALKRIIVE